MSLVITLTGMSTSGKSTLAQALTQTGSFQEAVSVTTRNMRVGETHGKDYYFVSDEQFDKYIQDNVLLEHVRSHHAAYGVPAFEVENILKAGKSPVLVLEPIGVKAIHDVCRARGYSIISAYVQTDKDVIIDRFFSRISNQIQAGKDLDYLSEAKRMHTMLTVEQSWELTFPWGLTLDNLHKDNRLEDAIALFEKYHSSQDKIDALEADLNTSIRIQTIKSIAEIADVIEQVVFGKLPKDKFLASTQEDRKQKTKDREETSPLP